MLWRKYKSEIEKPFGRSRSSWKVYIKTDLKNINCEDMD
jgi:hypothetical protein